MSYFDELVNAMATLAKDERTIFVGQGVGCAGTTMTDTLKKVPPSKLLEFPVAEDLQMGFCIGLALQGYLPICIFPRWNFLLCAANQIVNHLDRLPIYSAGGFNPKVIIRVATPITAPFNPGPQHDDDFSYAFRTMCRTIEVVSIRSGDDVGVIYARAHHLSGSSIICEFTELYGAIPSGVPERERATA